MTDDDNSNARGLTGEQKELLVQFAATRAARHAVAAGVPSRPDLADQLREMDEVFASHPDGQNPLVQENYELQRQVAILTAALRAALTGEVTVPAV